MASKILLLLLVGTAAALPLRAQIPSNAPARSVPTEIEKMNTRVAALIAQAESRFKEGELHLKAGERQQSRAKFDMAIDLILESGLDIRADQRLQTYYIELVERIYSLEVSGQQVGARTELSRNVTADDSGQLQSVRDIPQQEPGFKHQKFEPSPLDEYSKLTPGAETSPFGRRCALSLMEAPKLRGLRLGMEIAEVRKALSDVKAVGSEVQPRDEFGASSVVFRGIKGVEFKGVSKLALKFLDDRLTSISVTYDGSVRWDNAAQFLSRINTALGLPNSWRFSDPRDTGDYKMECRGLNLGVEFNSGIYPSLTFSDSEAPKIVIKRREEKEELRRRAEAEKEERRRRAEEERRKEFKP